MSDGHLRLAFDRTDGGTAPMIDLPVDRGPIHLHLHLTGSESVATPRSAIGTQPSPWRSFWIAFAAIAAIGSVYAIGVHMGAGRSATATAMSATDAEPSEVSAPPGGGQTDALAVVQRQVAQPPTVTPPPGAAPVQAAAPNPFGLRP